ncbi:MAG: alpha/beta hydrolase [Alphaproteobacteria bacterium]|nr:alpha/beta hydrolase [Alphaproteobacteria bacterium]
MAVPAYVSRGRGADTVLFLHGVGGGKECWQPQLEACATRYTAAAWDMPGYGESPPLEEVSFPALADAALALADHLAADRVHLVGHSLGGMVALEFAARHADRLASLVLSGTSPAFGNPEGDWQKRFLADRLKPLDQGRSMADLAPGIVASLVGTGPDPEGVELAVAAMSRVPAESYRAMMELLVTFDRRDVLAKIAVPTLVLAGEEDTNASPSMMAKMAEKIAGAHFEALPVAGHLANMERPGAFNHVLLDFLERCRTAPAKRMEI